MNFIEAIWPIPGPLAAALVAGTISFVVTVLAKDQKTSEFRQAWIDGLRTDVADFSGIAGAMSAITDAMRSRGADADSYLLERHDDFSKLESLSTKIRLRLNPKEHIELLTALNLFKNGSPATKSEIEDAIHNTVEAAQKILKLEWSRVKEGERAFKWLKSVSLSLIIAMPLLALGFAFTAPKNSSEQPKPVNCLGVTPAPLPQSSNP